MVIDSDSRKVQFCIENALITEPYLKEDVIGEDNPNHVEGQVKVRCCKWQEEYLQELATYLNSFITEVVSVPEHLKLTLPGKFSPKRLLKMFSLDFSMHCRSQMSKYVMYLT